MFRCSNRAHSRAPFVSALVLIWACCHASAEAQTSVPANAAPGATPPRTTAPSTPAASAPAPSTSASSSPASSTRPSTTQPRSTEPRPSAPANAKPGSAEARSPEPRQNAEATNGGIAVNASGQAKVEIHQTIQQRDPEALRILKNLQDKMTRLDERVSTLTRDSEKRREQLLNEQADGVDEVLRKARERNASPAARAAIRSLEKGSTLEAEILLRESEQLAAEKQPPDRKRAAELAREQGALAMARDTQAALEAYRRATEYEPENPNNWWSLGDLLMQTLRRSEAAEAYERMASLAAERLRQEPSNDRWRSTLATAHRLLTDAYLAQDDVPRAVEAANKSLVLTEEWYASKRSRRDAQHELALSLMQVARTRLAGVGEMMKGPPPANTSSRDFMAAVMKDAEQRATDAEASYRRALTLINEMLDRDAHNDTLWLHNADCHEGIGWALMMMQRRDARGEVSKHVDVLERLAKKNPESAFHQRNLAMAYVGLGDYLTRTEREPASALIIYRKSLTVLQELTRRDPSNVRWQLDLASLYRSIAWLAQPWVTVPSMVDPSYRDYMKPPVIPRPDAMVMLQEAQRILGRLDAQGLLVEPDKVLQKQIESELRDLKCQVQGFESGLGGQCFRPLPAHVR